MKILYITTIGNTMDFFKSFIRLLLDEGHIVEVAANENDGRVPECYRKWGCKVHQIDTSRSPLCKRNFHAIKQIRMLVELSKYDIVHCHTPVASMCTRIACRKIRKNGTKVFYTAHGFHFYKGAPLKNWLLYYPVEWLCAHFTDVLITINQEDYALAQKKMKAKKVVYVPGVGIDLNEFSSAYIDRNKKRRELGIEHGDKMLLSVGELSARKNHRIVIEALAKLNDPSVHYFIVGRGDLRDELEALAREKGVSLHLLGFRSDVCALIQASDLFVSPSFQEGLPVALMEAIACKIPAVCSEIEGNTDLVANSLYLFKPDDSEVLAAKIRNALTTDNSEVINANYAVLRSFDLRKVESILDTIYRGVLHRLILRQRLEKELGIERDRTLILSVGELNENKNHVTVIKALTGMENVEYLIAGRGDLKDELKNTAEALGVHLHLLGFRTDVAELYRACDLYILPSYREGLNISLVEAMASGMPCVASNIRGNKDLINDFLFDPTNEYDVRRTLIKAITSCIGSRSYKVDQFGNEYVTKKMRDIYKCI